MDGSIVVEEADEVDDDDANAVAPQPAPATRTIRASKMPRAGLRVEQLELGGVILLGAILFVGTNKGAALVTKAK